MGHLTGNGSDHCEASGVLLFPYAMIESLSYSQRDMLTLFVCKPADLTYILVDPFAAR